jgi:hypothetical protein
MFRLSTSGIINVGICSGTYAQHEIPATATLCYKQPITVFLITQMDQSCILDNTNWFMYNDVRLEGHFPFT